MFQNRAAPLRQRGWGGGTKHALLEKPMRVECRNDRGERWRLARQPKVSKSVDGDKADRVMRILWGCRTLILHMRFRVEIDLSMRVKEW